jgi:hypothetical protein
VRPPRRARDPGGRACTTASAISSTRWRRPEVVVGFAPKLTLDTSPRSRSTCMIVNVSKASFQRPASIENLNDDSARSPRSSAFSMSETSCRVPSTSRRRRGRSRQAEDERAVARVGHRRAAALVVVQRELDQRVGRERDVEGARRDDLDVGAEHVVHLVRRLGRRGDPDHAGPGARPSPSARSCGPEAARAAIVPPSTTPRGPSSTSAQARRCDGRCAGFVPASARSCAACSRVFTVWPLRSGQRRPA